MNTNFKQSSAYELADALAVESSQMEYGYVVSDWELLYNSSKMLRQQADRIAELEKEVEECWCGGHSYAYLKAKNRLPQTKTENIWTSCSACGQKVTEDLIHTCSPQLKPLSDEEIDEVSKAIWERPWLEKHREFARAIEERHGIK